MRVARKSDFTAYMLSYAVLLTRSCGDGQMVPSVSLGYMCFCVGRFSSEPLSGSVGRLLPYVASLRRGLLRRARYDILLFR